MYFLYIIILLLIGFMFIVTSINKSIPFLKNVYSGVITGMDQDLKIVTVEYYKKGEKKQGTFTTGRFSDSLFSIEFHGQAGMKVNVYLDKNGSIQSLMIPRDKKEKAKISWGTLIIGLLLFSYGIYQSILIIVHLFK